jgi:hypothetical protein
MRLIAAFVLAAAAVLCGCESHAGAPPAPTTNGEPVAASPYHDVRPPEQYFQALTPGLQADLQTTGIPWTMGGMLGENLRVSEQDYLAALHKAQSAGLDALSGDQRLIVLFVSAAALAAQEHTIRYRLVAADPTSGTEIGHLVAEERYRFDAYEGYTLPNLSQRRTVGQGLADDVGVRPHLAADAPDEVVESYDFTNVGAEDEKVTRIRCERTGQTWVRREGDYTEQYALDWPFHIFPNSPLTVGAEAHPQGVEVIDGRPAYLLTQVETIGPGKSAQSRLWLDKGTLWPLQWESEIDAETARDLHWDYQGRGYTIRGTVEEVNGEVDIPSLSESISCGQ